MSPGGLWYGAYPSLPLKPDPIATPALEVLLKANTIGERRGAKHAEVFIEQGSRWVKSPDLEKLYVATKSFRATLRLI